MKTSDSRRASASLGAISSLRRDAHYQYQQMADNRINTPNTLRNPLKYEVRKVQRNQRSIVLILPKIYCELLDVAPRDEMKFRIHKDEYTGQKGILMEKVSFELGGIEQIREDVR